jgi:polysaccharide pyruvyl transferase WcaK-like protein
VENDKKFGLDKICTIISNNSNERKISRLRYYSFALKEKLISGDRDLEEISYRNKSALFDRENTFVLSIGGDNYCYSGMQHVLSEQLKVFSYNHMQCGLWGCSFEEKLLTRDVISDLKKYKLITVRESISQEMLCRNGISDTVVSCSDPAFTLRKEKTTEYDHILIDENTIGVNVSALMNGYDSYPDATYKNFYELIKEILSTTDCNILMIPHVRQFGNDDLVTINRLADELHSSRVTVLSHNYNCMQLKDVISKCRLFIGCRTHATIAAYSSCVPTFVVGYSTKAKGICKDLFGTYDGLLVDAREFKTNYDLSKQFSIFLQNEKQIRNHLHSVMPEYIQRAYRASRAIEKIVGGMG